MEYNSNNIYNVKIHTHTHIYIYIYIYTYSKSIYQTNDFHLNFVLQTNLEKMYHSIKILGSTTVFNIDDNKNCFLSSKSAY